MLLLGFLAAVLVELLDPLTLILALLVGFWWPQGPALWALTLVSTALRFGLTVAIRGDQAAHAPELYVLGVAAAALAGALGVLLGAGLYHLLMRMKGKPPPPANGASNDGGWT